MYDAKTPIKMAKTNTFIVSKMFVIVDNIRLLNNKMLLLIHANFVEQITKVR